MDYCFFAYHDTYILNGFMNYSMIEGWRPGMTSEERIVSLHARMAALSRRRRQRKVLALCICCAGLCLGLFLLIISKGAFHGKSTAGQYSDTTVLFSNAGGYVLVALVAFMIGVIVTVARQMKRRKGLDLKTNTARKNEEEK